MDMTVNRTSRYMVCRMKLCQKSTPKKKAKHGCAVDHHVLKLRGAEGHLRDQVLQGLLSFISE